MPAFWSRILVAAAGLPLVLGLVWLGGWWLFALAAVAGALALHEFFTITRPLRPLVPAGYAGGLLAILGAQLGGADWALGGLMCALPLALLLKGLGDTRGSATAAIGATVLGAAWIGVGLASALLIRDIPAHGRLAILTVVLAVFAGDTMAYFTGCLIGRHKLWAAVSPGKTWEGFVGGTIATVAVAFFALYQDRDDFIPVWQALVLGAVLAVAAPAGDLFESAVKRDMQVKDSGRLLAGHGGVLDRIDALLFGFVASYYLLRGLEQSDPIYTSRVAKRIALLGATGSIGRQALQVIDSQPGLELCAAASGSSPLDAIDAPLTQVGGDLVELLDRAEPDVVLNAVVGFAGLPVTLWALERGVDLALANKESLVAAGDLALAAQERGGGRILPVDSEHSAIFQCLEGRAPGTVKSIVLMASGGPFRGRNREELADVEPAHALAHPTWAMGPKITVDSATLANKGLELIEAHFLFGLPYDRIEVVVHPTSVVHSLVRFRDGACLAHLGYPDMRVPISFALTYPDRAPTPIEPLDLAGGMTLEFGAPDLETFPLLRLAREAGERGGTYPCAFNAANEVGVAAFLDGKLPFLGIADAVEEALDAVDGAPARDLDDLIEADAQARRAAERKTALV